MCTAKIRKYTNALPERVQDLHLQQVILNIPLVTFLALHEKFKLLILFLQ